MISAAYERSLPVAQRRFDAFAQDSATWAAAALDALHLANERNGKVDAAAAQLASELEIALRELRRTVQAP